MGSNIGTTDDDTCLTWVPRTKGFRLEGRFVPFSAFDVALFIGLLAMEEILTFGDEGVCSKLDGLVWE